ncbi:MAG: hypothetical protein OXH69_06430 [Acidobacteria bacterium]|nr:hypothetical protein [Acidobacteriota bacterium]
MTELADRKMAGALEAVNGVVVQADSGAVTADEATDGCSTPGSRRATTERGRCRATRWRPSIGAVPGGPAALVERQATLTRVNRARRPAGLVSLPRSARQGKARKARAIFSSPAARW